MAEKSGSGTLIVRTVLIGVLIGAVALAVADRMAGGKCQKAYEVVKAALKPGEKQLTPDGVKELVGFDPQETTDDRRQEDHFYFGSPVRKYRLTVMYAGAGRQRIAQECETGTGAAKK